MKEKNFSLIGIFPSFFLLSLLIFLFHCSDESSANRGSNHSQAINSDANTNTDFHDSDHDGLIEIGSLVQFNAIRYDFDGNGEADDPADAAIYAAAGLGKRGCPDADAPLTTTGEIIITSCIGYELISDLDFDRDGNGADAGDYNSFTWYDSSFANAGWLPITYSDATNPPVTAQLFRAIFEGNGHRIGNLYIDRRNDSYRYSSLFGKAAPDAQLRNIVLEAVDVSGDIAAGLVSLNFGLVSNSSVSGSVSGQKIAALLVSWNMGTIIDSSASGMITLSDIGGISSLPIHAGGLVGLSEGPVSYSYADVEIEGRWNRGEVGSLEIEVALGGLVGSSDAFIGNSFAAGSIEAGGIGAVVGGLVGVNLQLVHSSYATAEVDANGGDAVVGGLAGYNRYIIRSSYSVGMVNAMGEESHLGGLIGRNEGRIASSYAAGLVNSQTTATYVGGLIGRNASENIVGNYWNSESTGQNSAVGGDNSVAIGGITELNNNTLAALDAESSGWDTNFWDFGEMTDNPALKNMPRGLEAQPRKIAQNNRVGQGSLQ